MGPYYVFPHPCLCDEHFPNLLFFITLFLCDNIIYPISSPLLDFLKNCYYASSNIFVPKASF